MIGAVVQEAVERSDEGALRTSHPRARQLDGPDPEELAAWLKAQSKVQDQQAIIQWNNKMRDLRLSEMAPQVQAYMEDYIPKYVPSHRPVYVYFDVYDLEEKRL